MSLAFLFYFQNDGVTPPTPTTPTFNGDIVPGDYSKTHVNYETRGALKKKRPRLKASLVREISKVSASEPTPEQLMRLAQAVLPAAAEAPTTDLMMGLMAAINDNLARAALEQMNEAAATAYRKRIIIDKIAEFMDMLEQDEFLLIYML